MQRPLKAMTRDQLIAQVQEAGQRAQKMDDQRRYQIDNQVRVINRLLKRIDLLNEVITDNGLRGDAEKWVTSHEELAANGSPRLHIDRDGVLRMFDSDGDQVWPPE